MKIIGLNEYSNTEKNALGFVKLEEPTLFVEMTQEEYAKCCQLLLNSKKRKDK